MPVPRSSLLHSIAAALLTLSALGCGVERASDADEMSRAEQEIIGGTLDNGDLAVVALAAHDTGGGFGVFCTGTLIAPQTILTAAHCVYSYGQNYTYYAHFGANGNGPISIKQIISQTRHPQYTGSGGTYDIAVLKLISPVTTVTPIPINTTTITNLHVGDDIRHVGYGVSSFSNGSPVSDGYKRQVTTPLRQVANLLLESGASNPTRQTCQGDSGGPGFMITAGFPTERVAGVVAFGDQSCASDGWDTKVDVFATWISTTYNQWEQPQCTEDGRCKAGCAEPDIDCLCAADSSCTAACTKPSIDPDCPRDCGGGDVCTLAVCPIPDPDCISEGNACDNQYQCKGRRCLTDPQHTAAYCSRDCATSTECPSGMECKSGLCNYLQRPVKLPFTACVASVDFCAEGTICIAETTTEVTGCYLPCTAQNTCLITGQNCVASPNNTRFCKDPTAPPIIRPQVVIKRAKLEASAAQGCSATGGSAMLVALLTLLPLRRRRLV